MEQQPSIGRVVHYVAFGTPKGEYLPEHRAAIITAVSGDDSQTVSLCVLNPTGMFFNQGCHFDSSSEPAGGTWHWPERV